MRRENKQITIKGTKEMSKLERFIEEICDFHNINNEYFGNILLATTESAQILISLNENQDTGKVNISYEINKKGLIFHLKLANSNQASEKNEDLLETEIRKHKLSKQIFIIKALTDEITIALDGKSIQLIFYVSSMNYEKSLTRIKKLKEYFEKGLAIKQREKNA